MNENATRRHELAGAILGQHSRNKRRGRFITSIFVVLGVTACLIALIWVQQQREAARKAEEVVAPANATEQFGFKLTPTHFGAPESPDRADELTSVVVYDDFLCESCRAFHEESGPFLLDLVSQGRITLTLQPFTFLVNQSTDEYSQRAANAAACVADASGVLAYVAMQDLLFAHQPEMGGPGLSDAELSEFAQQASDTDLTECITERRFERWVEAATDAGLSAQVEQTPTVRVNGINVVRSTNGRESMPGPDEILAAIEALT